MKITDAINGNQFRAAKALRELKRRPQNEVFTGAQLGITGNSACMNRVAAYLPDNSERISGLKSGRTWVFGSVKAIRELRKLIKQESMS